MGRSDGAGREQLVDIPRVWEEPLARNLFAVLRFSGTTRASQSTVRRAYDLWRTSQGIPARCDNEECCFYRAALQWNRQPLKLILDHRDGNRYDNTPSNLRLLCPACNSQLATNGGGNRGRVRDLTDDGYEIVNKDGTRIVAATGRM